MATAKSIESDSMRVDLWLWVARFYKTRALAQKAIGAGHVALNGATISKTSRALKVGDQLKLTLPNEQRMELEVLGLTPRRGPASVAQTLYSESEDSRKAREAAAELRRLQGRLGPLGRPDGRDRRLLRALKERSSGEE